MKARRFQDNRRRKVVIIKCFFCLFSLFPGVMFAVYPATVGQFHLTVRFLSSERLFKRPSRPASCANRTKLPECYFAYTIYPSRVVATLLCIVRAGRSTRQIANKHTNKSLPSRPIFCFFLSFFFLVSF